MIEPKQPISPKPQSHARLTKDNRAIAHDDIKPVSLRFPEWFIQNNQACQITKKEEEEKKKKVLKDKRSFPVQSFTSEDILHSMHNIKKGGSLGPVYMEGGCPG